MAKLSFMYGAMNSGKSTALLQTAHNYEERGLKVMLLKPKRDSKGEDMVVSRIGVSRKVDYLIGHDDSILSIISLQRVNNLPDAIFVDEAQFLSKEQVDELYLLTKDYKIKVLAYGIRSDFVMGEFPGSTRLFTIADSIKELKTICRCGSKATQNLRMYDGVPIFEGDSILIDDSKNQENRYSYESVCGRCYIRTRRKYTNKNQ